MCTGLRTRRRAEGSLIVRSALAGALALSVASAGFSDTVPSPVKARGSDSLFQIRNGERWGYMDRNGQTIIPPRFDREGDFFGGRAKVQLGGKWGYIDSACRPVAVWGSDDSRSNRTVFGLERFISRSMQIAALITSVERTVAT